MCQMLLSINTEHVENILLGKKKFEFRKVRCKNDIDKIIIYATHPVMQVVAEVEVIEIIDGNLDSVWDQTSEYAGISKNFFYAYYEGKERAIAYRLGKVKKYRRPKTLSDFGIRVAPQSFVYLHS